MNPPARPKVALIAGPTASGKSALAIALARRSGGTVINADSAQVYAELRVLSARPSPEEEAQAPHRLFGHVAGTEDYSAARWAGEAKAEIAAAHDRGSLPILAGGTGMYIRTLLDGIAPVPEIDPAIRAEVRALPVAESYRQLVQADPEAAKRLNPADTTRVGRALEVVRSTGRTLADWQDERVGGIADAIDLAPLILLPDRAWLAERCDRRLSAMFDDGAIEEVEDLLQRSDIPANAPVRRAIGVAEIAAFLEGSLDRDEALERAQAATRQYAKRQYTWLRNQPPADWPQTDSTDISKQADHFARFL
ncbi:tRNA (adenosine(37)-N6)-dimethylallyltransferase MiaA [Sphingomonas koreensis]|uniref:tRNA (adenosine(37)-N6)-dimethylallyltransferase MiaA n=1 Tax=Sphingomonas koreensis TaxID=93064 RepID=UPI000832C32E|nr:tRNA (adenosine(37)-N6)-dimethylallyltransferase MiaA [Sphingomonas koreensis]PJI86850.1 tRNA dimethylallyltransferase [Sphingomonas koreensis]RSU60089.1 tRNA (adenosine(37)-N6)-dimethylallyltransferase MiaA [Sphingomonas koreensis]RSU68027.1 tRNA (adenosine(37)-N6)-dimethylallyltransferase MiaA [Sphingomonas koreensis]